jgi:putative acyl-CoA dehydrogenase
MCLDVLRAITREPEQSRAVLERLMQDGAVPAALRHHAVERGGDESQARLLVEQIATIAAAAALSTSAPANVVEAFVETRVRNQHGRMFGAVEFPTETIQSLHERALAA